MTNPTADRPLTKTEWTVKAARSAPEWVVRQIGNLGAPLLLGVSIITARLSADDVNTGALGFAVAGLFGMVSVALAYSQGHDRGQAKRITSTHIKLTLGDGYVLAEKAPSHD